MMMMDTYIVELKDDNTTLHDSLDIIKAYCFDNDINIIDYLNDLLRQAIISHKINE